MTRHYPVGVSVFVLIFFFSFVNSFYLPGVAPKDFTSNEIVELKVNKLTSVHTHMPLDYYSLKFCRPEKIKQISENLGEMLSGDKIENSPYEILAGENEYCKILCQVELNSKDLAQLEHCIHKDYHHNWIIDNLPSASFVTQNEESTPEFRRGFPIGYIKNNEYYIYNHVIITLHFHPVDETQNLRRIVGFYVYPISIHHKFQNDVVWNGNIRRIPVLTTCNPIIGMAGSKNNPHVEQKLSKNEKILFTYDIEWQFSETEWASRWDIYLSMNNAVSNNVHWFSILNSIVVVIGLSVLIAIIFIRTLHHDILRYNRLLTDEEMADEIEERGWKLIHTDVFRPPSTYLTLYCLFVGTGVQILSLAFVTLIFAAIGFLSPANRGSLMIACLSLFSVTSSFAGYCSVRLYKTFKGKNWVRLAFFTGTLFPGICFLIFLIFDVFLATYHSTGAVPVLTFVSVLVLWFGISFPLVFFGAWIGAVKSPITFPAQTNSVPRMIPEQPWHLNTYVVICFGGIMPFGACFVELYFILSSLWMDQYYYVFGFTFLAFVILVLTCFEVSIILCYYQLCRENYAWWWRSFLSVASTGIYVFMYSAFYFKNLKSNFYLTYLMYFGYMGIISFGVFLMTGSIGTLSCLWFTRRLFSSIKID